MIEGGEFSLFAVEVMERRYERDLWELYLAKVQGQSFNDFKESLERKDEPRVEQMTQEEIIAQTLAIVGKSKGGEQ